MPALNIMRTKPVAGVAAAVATGWMVYLFGVTAMLCFLAWTVASLLKNQELAYSFFYAFSVAMVAAMGLFEYRKTRSRRSR